MFGSIGLLVPAQFLFRLLREWLADPVQSSVARFWDEPIDRCLRIRISRHPRCAESVPRCPTGRDAAASCSLGRLSYYLRAVVASGSLAPSSRHDGIAAVVLVLYSIPATATGTPSLEANVLISFAAQY